VVICGQCFWKWTPKNPSPNKGNLTLDVPFCFNFYQKQIRNEKVTTPQIKGVKNFKK
jgi:hypothetical protein